MSGWISIKDQEPPKGQAILITDGKVMVVSFWQVKREGKVSGYRGRLPASPEDPPPGEMIFSVPFVEYVWEGDGFGLSDQMGWEWTFKDYDITHWMPLPPLPGKEGS